MRECGVPPYVGLFILRLIVFDFHTQPAIGCFRAQDHIAALRALRNTVADRILYKRLEQEPRHLSVLCVGIDGIGDIETRAEAYLFEREIFSCYSDLLLERDLMRIGRLECAPQRVGGRKANGA